MSWTVENELLSMSGAEAFSGALASLGLSELDGSVAELVLVRDWYRGGAETYEYEFDLVGCTHTYELIMKACVTGDLSVSLANQVSSWVSRRRMLGGAGISVPHLWAYKGAMLLEERIPYTFSQAMRQSDFESQMALTDLLGHVSGVITSLGFPCMSLSDLRSRGRDVVMIDFGQDLGPPGLMSSDNASVAEQALELLERATPHPDPPLVAALSAGFERGLTAGSR